MPVDWQVGPEEDAAAGEPPRPGRWWLMACVAASAVIFLGGLVLRTNGEARREREQLMLDLTAVVLAEAQAQAQHDTTAAEALLDPDAPRDWAQRYRHLFSPAPVNPYNELCGVYGSEWHPNVTTPILHVDDLREQAGHQRVLARLAWQEGSAARELRAYREIAGAWHRTPLSTRERTRGTQQTRQAGEVVLQGPASDLTDLLENPALAVDFVALDRRLRSDLAFLAGPLLSQITPATTVVVRPTELEAPVIEMGIAPARQVVVNSPLLALVNPDGPLSADGLYRMAVVQAVVSTRYHQLGVDELPFGPNWSLTDAEAKLIRNRLRQALAGEWRSQLQRDPAGTAEYQVRHDDYAEWQRRCISDALLVGQLLASGRVSSIGDLLQRLLANDGPRALSWQLDLSGQPNRAAYDAWARAWASTPEP